VGAVAGRPRWTPAAVLFLSRALLASVTMPGLYMKSLISGVASAKYVWDPSAILAMELNVAPTSLSISVSIPADITRIHIRVPCCFDLPLEKLTTDGVYLNEIYPSPEK
jgi:hypothetical protein